MKLVKRIVSIVLAVVMTAVEVPLTTLSVNGDVAAIGTTGYSTLTDAFAAAEDGDTITLLQDYEWTEDSMDLSGKSVTLDFGGYKLSAEKNLFNTVSEDAGLTFKNASVEGSNYNYIVNENKGKVTFDSTSGDGVVWNGYVVNENYGDVIVNSGLYEVGDFLEYNYNNASFTVNGGTFNSNYFVYDNNGIVKLENAEITADSYVVEYVYDNACVECRNCQIDCAEFIWDGYSAEIIIADSTIDSSEYNSNDPLFRDCGGSITLSNSMFIANSDCFGGGRYSTINAENCTFISKDNDCIDGSFAELTLTNCTLQGYYNAVYSSNSDTIITINGGTFSSENSDVFYIYDSEITINDGTFSSENEDCFEFYDSKITIDGGTFSSGVYNSLYSQNSEITINGGTFTAKNNESPEYPCVYIDKDSTVTINGGTFTAGGSNSSALYVEGGGSAILRGGIFDGAPALKSISEGGIVIDENYHAVPEEWEAAEHVEIVPYTMTVNFYSEGRLYYSYSGYVKGFAFPEAPVNSEGAEFISWRDVDWNLISDASEINSDMDLYAVFTNTTVSVTFHDTDSNRVENVIYGSLLSAVPGIDRTESGDGFLGWMVDNVLYNEGLDRQLYADTDLFAAYTGIIYTYQELVDAIAQKRESIIIGADIVMPEGVDIDYNCTISGQYLDQTHKLICGESFNGRAMMYYEDSANQADIQDLVFDGANLHQDFNDDVIYISQMQKVYMENVTICNHKCECGIHATVNEMELRNVKICNNEVEKTALNISGFSIDKKEAVTDLYDCEIAYNDNDAPLSNGAGIYFTLATIKMHGNTSVHHNSAYESGGINGLADCVLEMYDNSEFSYNVATRGNGGVTSITELDIYMYDNSSMHHNQAPNGLGGAIRETTYRLEMYDHASIYDNDAKNGGGVCFFVNELVPILQNAKLDAEMIYDNTASEYGDDIVAYRNLDIFAEQPARLLGDGRSAKTHSVTVEQIPGYYEAELEGEVWVPWLGWFKDASNARYTYETRSECTFDVDAPFDIEAVKAVWYGTVLAYDGNYENGGHQFDQTVYEITSSASVKDCLFDGPSDKMFIGWNTKADGTGTSYDPGDDIPMDSSKVLYAMWAEISWGDIPVFYVVHHAVHGNLPDTIDVIPMFVLEKTGGAFDITVPLESGSYDVDRTFNYTKFYNGIREGYIYGGMYEGAHDSKEYDEDNPEFDLCGKELVPQAGDYFYLREVSEEFLQPRIISVRRHTGDLHVERYLLTAVDCDGADKAFYGEYGFIYNPHCEADEIDDYMQSGAVELDTDEEIYDEEVDEDGPEYENMSCILYEYLEVYKNNTLQDRYDQTNVFGTGFTHITNDDYFGCVPYKTDFADSGDETANGQSFSYDFHYTPYYVTADGVFVTGIVERYTDLSQAETTTAANNYDEKLASGSLTYCHHGSVFGPMKMSLCFAANPDAVKPAPQSETITITVHANGETSAVSVKPGDISSLMTAPEFEGLRFVGWYADEAYTAAADFTDVQTSMDVYARYINDTYFSVQLINTTSKKAIIKTRIVTVVDSPKKYREIGFEITLDGEKTVYTLTKEYAVVNGYTPVKLFGERIDGQARLMYQDMKLKDLADGTQIEILPYYVTADGSKLYGTPRRLLYYTDYMENIGG